MDTGVVLILPSVRLDVDDVLCSTRVFRSLLEGPCPSLAHYVRAPESTCRASAAGGASVAYALGAASLAGDDVQVMPHQLLFDGEHQHDGVLEDGDRIRATVVGHGDLGLPRGLDIHAIVAGAGELDE